MQLFNNPVILVTGAGRGMGRAVAEALAGAGAIVVAQDLSPINLDETLARIAAQGGRAHGYLFDPAKAFATASVRDVISKGFFSLPSN